MSIRDGLRSQLWNLFPKRDFRLLVDPSCLSQFLDPERSKILQLIVDLSTLSSPIHVQLLTTEKPPWNEPLFELIEGIPSDIYVPVRLDEDDPRSRLLEPSAKHEGALCVLAARERVDGIVTVSAVLLAARYALTQDLINIISVDELGDFVEICAHGHNVFWSVSHSCALNQDVYYVLAHHKGKRLSNWWGALPRESLGAESQEQLRSLILNRYPFILFARDMVRFYRLQRDDSRRNGDSHYSFGLTYHLNQFYILLWGMLDQLSLLANLIFALKLDSFDCGIRRPRFMKALEKQIPGLSTFLTMPIVHDWISLMSDFRHAAAHQVIPMPTEIVIDTEESKKSKDEILTILREEDPDFEIYKQSSLSPESKAWFEDLAVSQWRDSKRERLADYMVHRKNKQGHYFRSPVVSIDHDLAMLTGIMDAFFVGMFRKGKITESPT